MKTEIETLRDEIQILLDTIGAIARLTEFWPDGDVHKICMKALNEYYEEP